MREDKPADEIVAVGPARAQAGPGRSPAVLELRGVPTSTVDRQVLEQPSRTEGEVTRDYDVMTDWILPRGRRQPTQDH